MTIHVVVCDDDPGFAQQWVSDIREVAPPNYDIRSAPTLECIRDAASVIFRRRAAARRRHPVPVERCLFDDTDVLILDYDLLHLDEDNAQYTGEGLARIVRMFSDCSVVVVLNQYPGTDFDLRLRGHIESYADLNIDAHVLATPGLWQSPPWDGFRPWSWQTLSDAVELQQNRVAFLNNRLDSPILEVLEMQPEDVRLLSDSAFGFLAPDIDNYESLNELSFADLISRSTVGRDALTLLDVDQIAACRLVSARIAKWLEREVLGPQEVLIDIPHLIQRFPFVLEDDISDVNSWNRVIWEPPNDLCTTHLFSLNGFLSRPAIWGHRLQIDAEFRRRRREFDYRTVPDFVFLEDQSLFARLADAHEFRSDFHNPFDRRFIARVEGIRYTPQRRLTFGA